MSHTKLTLAISTLTSRLDAALTVFDKLTPCDSVEMLILVQGGASEEENGTDSGTVRIEYLDTLGLSHSRNAALEISKGDFVWFLDDDVAIDNQDLNWLLRQLGNDSAVHIGQIKCSDCDNLYKDYSRNREGKVGALRTSSIEIIAPRQKIQDAGIKFNTQIGLGTAFPSGEENLFLLDALASGLIFQHLNRPIISHPCLLEERKPGNSWKNQALVRSKGIIARHVGGITGITLAIWWGARASYYNRSPIGMLWVLSSLVHGQSITNGIRDNKL